MTTVQGASFPHSFSFIGNLYSQETPQSFIFFLTVFCCIMKALYLVHVQNKTAPFHALYGPIYPKDILLWAWSTQSHMT